MKKLARFTSCGLVLAVATCTQQQIDLAATSACAVLVPQAQAQLASVKPAIVVASKAVLAVCSDPAASAAEADAARVMLKNAINGSS